MPEWKRLPGDAVNWQWDGDGIILRLGEDVNEVSLSPGYRYYQTASKAKDSFYEIAQRLRRMADDIEAAVASAPKESSDA